MTKVDVLVVGQGLAGTALSYYLMQAGCRVQIINDSKPETASRAAAGLYNPITGRKMVKTWLADKIFPKIEPFYQELESLTGQHFLHPMPIYRPFLTNAERSDWSILAPKSIYQPYISQVFQHSNFSDYINDPLGGILLQRSGYVDLPVLLSATQQYFREQDVYQEEIFDVTRLRLEKTGVQYGDYRSRWLIFCDGADGYRNSFFHWLPYQPVKGEILLIDTEKKSNIVFNRGIFVMPFGDKYKVGSTYDHQDLTFAPTQKGRDTLQSKLGKLLTMPYRVVEQWAGVRPATRDRRPFVGIHPVHQTLGIFNGLGTKGVSLAPYFAQHFTRFLTEEIALSPEIDIQRFESFYHPTS